jgi:hypothetical protein
MKFSAMDSAAKTHRFSVTALSTLLRAVESDSIKMHAAEAVIPVMDATMGAETPAITKHFHLAAQKQKVQELLSSRANRKLAAAVSSELLPSDAEDGAATPSSPQPPASGSLGSNKEMAARRGEETRRLFAPA